MYMKHALMMLLAMNLGTVAQAQEPAPDDKPVPCVVAPVFHCMQALADGTVLGHFGYSYSCADGSEPETELFVEIGEDNRFTPGSEDRGQSKLFWGGEHAGAFEVEMSAEEIEKKVDLAWTVLGRAAHVNYTRTRDASLDCEELSK